MLDVRFEVHKDKTLREATEMAWKVDSFEHLLSTCHVFVMEKRCNSFLQQTTAAI